jgi:hypothetical protein
MTNKISRVQSMLEPIWQEISSLWSGAEFAFYDQSLDTDEADSQSARFASVARIENTMTADMGQLGQCC